MRQIDQVGPEALPALKETVARILAEAKQQGASSCEVAVSLQQGLSTDVRDGQVETVEFNRDQGFGITLYVGQRKGSASTSATGEAAIKETVAAALAIARETSEDDCAGLPAAELMAKDCADLDLYHPWALTPDEAGDWALRCEQAALAVQGDLKSDGVGLSTHYACQAYGNSHGFIQGHSSTRHSLSCTMIAQGEQTMQRDYAYDISRVPSLLKAPETIGQEAALKAIRRLGARPIPTCEVPVIFSASIATGLIGHFFSAISGGNQYRKMSFLAGALGEQVFPDWMQLIERPHILRGLASARYDADGLATYSKPFVEDGRISSYVLSTYSARKLGMQSTANAGGTHNIEVVHGDQGLDSLIKQMGRGLLVTELIGQGPNIVTGDYSRGAGGFWVENGEIQFPVDEVTIAGSLRDMFRNLVAIGNDIEHRSSIATGSILLEKMTVGGR